MAEPFLAEIVMFGGNFAPRGWAFCDGQIIAINQNSALFSLLGTIYGGDGRTTFALPDMRGRMPIGPRRGPGLTEHQLGEKGGRENVTLLTQNMPSHNHTATTRIHADQLPGETTSPAGAMLADSVGNNMYNPLASAKADLNDEAATTSIGQAGGNIGFNVQNPFLAVNFIIAMVGTFPSRN